MFVVNTPICPRCGDCVMSRELSALDWIGMAVFTLLFFPLAIFIFLTPKRLHCRCCGKVISDRPESA
jgi:hypothetical protein